MLKDNKCVHLDFHTSELIPNVGAEFDAEDFKANLSRAGLDSITVFAKCHHGCFYYEDTNFFKHPHLCGSLLDKQLAACKEAGVSAKIYISAGFDEHAAQLHPEWLTVNDKGELPAVTRFRRLCFNTPYLQLLKEQTAEVVKKYMPDGVFFDIISEVPCYCEHCLADMERKGLDPQNQADVMKQAKDVMVNYFREVEGVVRGIKPDCMIFQNGGDFPVGEKERMDACDQLETESLPTGGWGYDHFPLSMAYIRRRGKNCIGMTGKFHRCWGEFGAYKYKTALLYEAVQCLALDAGFSVGDQLHPSGAMEPYTYESIGFANAYTKLREPWRGGKYLAEAAIYAPGCKGKPERVGLSRILFEEKILFDMIDEEEISNEYKVIFLVIDRPLKQSEYQAFNAFLSGGGKLMAMGENGLFNGQSAFDFGFSYEGEDEERPCYVRARYPLAHANNMALVAYEKAYNVTATGEVLADKLSPYFTRAGARFCSHLQTPYNPEKSSAAITEGPAGIYLAVNLFAQYAKDGSLTAKQLLAPLVARLLGSRTVITDLPTSGKAALYEKDGKHVLHLWYANTIKRGDGVEIIEDIVTLSQVRVSVAMAAFPKRVVLQPTGECIPFNYVEGRIEFSVKDFYCYQIIEFD